MSILDQVRKNQFQENVSKFNPVETLNFLFSHLNDKERDIIKRRFGLHEDAKDGQTLEEIGQKYGITRERVRQIENLSLKKLKELREMRSEIKEAEGVVTQLLEQYGGIMEETFFLESILNYLETHDQSDASLLFLAEHIFSDNVTKVKSNKEYNHLWRTGSSDVNLLKDIIAEIVKIIEVKAVPIDLAELLNEFKKTDFFQKNKERVLSVANMLDISEEDTDKILESYLRASRRIKQDVFDRWGLVSWGTVSPKKINDKIYLVLKKSGKPMHFTEITKQINEAKFDDKIAYPATVHNELILDEKYVLVGRGIYALKEWGYNPGTVSDVVENLIKENGPLTKEQIIEKVLEKRQVKKSTIYLSLMNNPRIKKVEDGKYHLVLDSE